MNTKQFQYVIVLARAGSFSKAAIELNISQPSLSQYVKKIEQEVGAPLFVRAGGIIRLTDTGRAFVDAGEKILRAERALDQKITEIKEDKSGTLVIGVNHSRTASAIASVIAKFKQEYPDICVIVDERVLGDVLEGAERGEFDFAIAPTPIDEKIFKKTKIMEEELVLAAPKNMVNLLHAEKAEGEKRLLVDVKNLDDLPFIVGKSAQIVQSKLDDISKTHGITIRSQIMIQRLEMQLEMVRQGLGLALVPTSIERFTDEIEYFNLKQEKQIREIVAFHRKDCPLSNSANRFIKLLQEVYL